MGGRNLAWVASHLDGTGETSRHGLPAHNWSCPIGRSEPGPTLLETSAVPRKAPTGRRVAATPPTIREMANHIWACNRVAWPCLDLRTFDGTLLLPLFEPAEAPGARENAPYRDGEGLRTLRLGKAMAIKPWAG